MHIADRAGARETRVDVDQRGAALLCFHHPTKPDRMALGHVRAFNDDAVCVGEILERSGGASSSE